MQLRNIHFGGWSSNNFFLFRAPRNGILTKEHDISAGRGAIIFVMAQSTLENAFKRSGECLRRNIPWWIIPLRYLKMNLAAVQCSVTMRSCWHVHELRKIVDCESDVKMSEREVLVTATSYQCSVTSNRFVPSSNDKEWLVDKGVCTSLAPSIL